MGRRPGVRHFVDRAVGRYLWRPWYDSVATPAVARVYFPLSRAWAAAKVAKGDPGVFRDALGDGAERRAVGRALLNGFDIAHGRYEAAVAAWNEGFFGAEAASGPVLATLEKRRKKSAQRFMALRAGFLPGHVERPFAPIRFEIEDPRAVEARHGPRLEASDAGFTPDLDAPVTESRSFVADGVDHRWVRFATPEGISAPPAEARVRSRVDAPPIGTMIFAHGISMETEMWGETGTVSDWFLDHGFRAVDPQGPWHARRVSPGYYGGERVFARGPGGLLDYSWAHVRELGRLIAWARESDLARGRAPRPVLLTGISLGALTAMQLLSWAEHWPAAARPDIALLIAPAASLTEVAYRGALTGGMGVPDALAQAGWTEDVVAKWTRLLDASRRPVTDPENTLLVLGNVDEITPYASGEALAREWAIPRTNLWTRDQGHFSVSLGITAAPEPLRRAAALARAMSGSPASP
jgi:predicted alpha/beta hydrolase family esterase